MKEINLNNLQLKIFTEQDTIDYCQLNSLNIEDITVLYLSDNKLTDISGIKLFKNLEVLFLFKNKLTDISVIKDLNNLRDLNISDNKITDISVIMNLNNLEILLIENLKLESDQIQYIKSLKNLKELWSRNGFKDMSVLNELNKNITVIK